MTQLSTTHKNELAKLYAWNTPIAGFGDAAGLLGSAALGNLYVRLCTDAVTVNAGTVGTEAAFTGYTAGGKAVARGEGNDLDVVANIISNTIDLEWFCDGAYPGSENIKYAELWKNNTETGEAHRISWCELSSIETVIAGKTFRIAAGNLTFPVN